MYKSWYRTEFLDRWEDSEIHKIKILAYIEKVPRESISLRGARGGVVSQQQGVR